MLQARSNLPVLDIGYLSKYGERFFEDEDHASKAFWPLIGGLILNDFCQNRQGRQR
jgi:hypothetical protein